MCEALKSCSTWTELEEQPGVLPMTETKSCESSEDSSDETSGLAGGVGTGSTAGAAAAGVTAFSLNLFRAERICAGN